MSWPPPPNRGIIPPRVAFDPHLPPQFPNPSHLQDWRALTSPPHEKKVVNSLASSSVTMNRFGIEEEVGELFTRSGFGDLELFAKGTYDKLVLQFYASFEAIYRGMDPECKGWSYCIQGEQIARSNEELCELLMLSGRGNEIWYYGDQDLIAFWNRISGSPLHDKNSSPKSIRSGVWKYVHRLVAVNINSRRDEGSRVTKEDLRVMLSMGEGDRIDYFQYLTKRMERMGNPYAGTITGLGCSSIITRIAELEGFYFRCPPNSLRVLNAPLMARMSMIDPHTHRWIHVPATSRGSRASSSRMSGGAREGSAGRGYEWWEPVVHDQGEPSEIVEISSDESS